MKVEGKGGDEVASSFSPSPPRPLPRVSVLESFNLGSSSLEGLSRIWPGGETAPEMFLLRGKTFSETERREGGEEEREKTRRPAPSMFKTLFLILLWSSVSNVKDEMLISSFVESASESASELPCWLHSSQKLAFGALIRFRRVVIARFTFSSCTGLTITLRSYHTLTAPGDVLLLFLSLNIILGWKARLSTRLSSHRQTRCTCSLLHSRSTRTVLYQLIDYLYIFR